MDTFERLRIALAGRYTIDRELGRGGMALVFLAYDVKHRRAVALKVLRPEIATTVATERFLREIEIAARLTHPHILPLYDSGAVEGQLYYVMPCIEGESLRSRLTREGRLPVADAVQIGCEIADALEYAHNQGVVHRDIKPENVLFSGGHAVVADFGIASAVSEAGPSTLTQTGTTLGTPAYMSPEQAGGRKVDHRSDLYALGCVIHEMLVGEPPFNGPNAQAVLLQQVQDAPPSLRLARPTLAGHIVNAVSIALAKDPADRFKSANELRDALTGRATRRRLPAVWRRAAMFVGSAAVAIAAVAAIWSWAGGGSRFRERDWVLVADFTGPPDDPGLGDAVRELTTAELNQSRFISTLPRQQLNDALRLAGKPPTTYVTPDIARELAFRRSVRAVLVGSISRLGRSDYSIVLQAIDAEEGTDIVSVAGAATDSTLVSAVQRLAREVREGLGERRSAVQANVPLDQVATPSFEAYRRYVEGVQLQQKGDGRGSNRVLHAALALDTGFASAWYVMGWNYLNDRVLDSARLAFGEALKRPDRLGIPRIYRVEADAAYAMRYDLVEAVHAYDLYLEHFTRSYSVLNNRGLYLLALGRYDEALRDFEQAVAMHPFGKVQAQIQLANQSATLIALARLGEARATARDLTGPFATYVSMMLATATDDWDGADTIARGAAAAPTSPNWLRVQAVATAASARAARGAFREADRDLERATLSAAPDVARWYGRARLLLAEVAERPPPPLPPAAARDTTAAGLVTYGLWTAQLGDTAGARTRWRQVQRLSDVVRARLGAGPTLLEARLAAAAGRWKEVTRLIAPAALIGEHDTSLLDRVNSLSLRWLAARAYAQLGQRDSALIMMKLLLRPAHMPGNAFALRGIVSPFAHRWLAEWAGEVGDHERARTHWRAVLNTLRTPDSEFAPLIARARTAL